MLSPTTCGAPPAAIHSLCAGGTISFGLRSCPSKLASTTGRIEFTWWPHDGHGVTAWSFSSRCSPPGVVAPMQLRSDTGLPVSARSGTLTLLSKSALRRTRAGFHPAPSFWNDEAIEHSLRACFKNRPVRGPGLQGFVILAVSRSGRVPGIAPRHPPTPPDVRFSASGGWTVQSASFSDTQTLDLRTLRRVERLLRLARRLPVWGGDRSCRVPLLRSVVRHGVQCLDWLRSFLRPFARNAFSFVRSSIATMASADFPASLKAGISPGQGLFFPFAPLGSTECRQWLLGFVVPSTLAPDILPHCPFVFLRSNVCLPPFRAASLRRRPGGSATVGTTSPRREPFIPPDQTPAGHTRAGVPACRFKRLPAAR